MLMIIDQMIYQESIRQIISNNNSNKLGAAIIKRITFYIKKKRYDELIKYNTVCKIKAVMTTSSDDPLRFIGCPFGGAWHLGWEPLDVTS